MPTAQAPSEVIPVGMGPKTSEGIAASDASAVPITLVAIALVFLLSGCNVSRGTPAPASPDFASPTPAGVGPTFRELATPALTAVSAESDVFGGAYVDDATGLHVLFVGDVSDARARLGPLIPHNLPVTYQRVPWSQSRLSEIKAGIIEFWQEIGIERISEVSVDIVSNRVVVGMPTSDAALEDELRGRYGAALTFEIAPPDEYAPR